MIDKLARSSDPAQQSLRDKKKAWNEEAKVFIAQMIAFKRGLNGRGDPRAGIPTSNIKDKFPSEIPNYLADMAGRFSRLSDEAASIIDAQEQYSETRTKSTKEASMNKIAANKITRWWTWVSQYPYFSDDKATKDRINLVYTLADLEKQINNIEYMVTSSETGAAFYNYLKFLSLFENQFVKSFDKSLENHSNMFKDKVMSGEKIPDPPERKDEKEEIHEPVITNFQEIANKLSSISDEIGVIEVVVSKLITLNSLNKLNVSQDDVDFLTSTVVKLKKLALNAEINAENKKEDAVKQLSQLKNIFVDLVKKVSFILYGKSEIDTAHNLLQEVMGIEKKSYLTSDITKLANKGVRRWLRRVQLGLKSDTLSGLKLDLANQLNELSKLFNKAQSLMEDKHSIIMEISFLVTDIYNLVADISDGFANLAETYNAEVQSDNFDSKSISKQIPRTDIFKVNKSANYYRNKKILDVNYDQ
jgi:hypothetical protein